MDTVSVMGPPLDVVTLLLKAIPKPERTIPLAPEVTIVPLNAAFPEIVVATSCWIEAAEIAAVVTLLTLPKRKGPMGVVLPMAPFKVTFPPPERKISSCGDKASLSIVLVMRMVPFPPDVSRMIGVRFEGSERRVIGLEREIP